MFNRSEERIIRIYITMAPNKMYKFGVSKDIDLCD